MAESGGGRLRVREVHLGTREYGIWDSTLVLHDIKIFHIDYCGLHSNNISIYWVVGGTVFIAIG